MTILKMIGCCSIGFILAGSVSAEDVKMFTNEVPSAEELGDILFSSKPGSKPGSVKTRSISFGKSQATPKELPKFTGENQSDSIVGLPIKFAYNSAEVLGESKSSLDKIGAMLGLAEYANEKLIIEGHTDASGEESYNKQLSEQRAQAVKDYLTRNFNVAAERLLVVGVGESQALPNLSPYSGVNRRVQFRKAP